MGTDALGEFLAIVALVSVFVGVSVWMLTAFLGQSSLDETARELWRTYFGNANEAELPPGGDLPDLPPYSETDDASTDE